MFCKGTYVKDPTCPMGYKPVGQGPSITDDKKVDELSGHVFQTPVLLKIAKSAMNKNDYNSSIECYEKILELKPNDPEASFLLKRAKFMVTEKSNQPEKAAKLKRASESSKQKSKKMPDGMLAQQQIGKIQIKPKQQFKVDPHIIGPESDKVYHADEDVEEKEKEEVSKHVAIKSKGSYVKKKGTTVALLLAIAIIIMIVVGLWLFGFLEF